LKTRSSSSTSRTIPVLLSHSHIAPSPLPNPRMQQSDDLKALYLLTLLSRVIIFLLVYLSAYFIPSFDSSQKTLEHIISKWSEPLLRWDSFYFLHIAREGYVYEQEWAFFRGTPMVMRYTGYLARLFSKNSPDLLFTGALAAMACDTTKTLYLLALHHLRSRNLAYLVSILSLMPSSPATLRLTPYTEPFFTYLSYKGELSWVRSWGSVLRPSRNAILHHGKMASCICLFRISRHISFKWNIPIWIHSMGFAYRTLAQD
jgi:hypothetical protein